MLEFRRLHAGSDADAAALFELLQAAPGYSMTVEGRLPTLQDARDALTEVPPEKYLIDKFIGGYWRDDALVGCMDLIRGHPEPDIAFLGLLLFSEANQRRGFGVEALAHIEQLAASWGCSSLRLAVIDRNERAFAFWHREGFRELYRKPTTRFTGDAVVMQRAI